jgi:ABC-type glycerol-3-phosphate transport system substrate-binding protein
MTFAPACPHKTGTTKDSSTPGTRCSARPKPSPAARTGPDPDDPSLEDLYVDDGTQLGFAPDDVSEWFEFWQALVKDGAAATPEFQLSLSGDLADGLVPTGKGAFQFAWSNQLTAFTEATRGGTVSIHTYPLGDGPDAQPGFYYNASMFLSVSAETEDPDAAISLANALLTDPDVAGELGYERGVPPSPKVQRALLPDASQSEKDSADYIDALAGTITDPPIPAPDGDAKVRDAYLYASEQAGFGKASNKDAIDRFFNDAQDALSS